MASQTNKYHNRLHNLLRSIALLVLFSLSLSGYSKSQWTRVAPGIEYMDLEWVLLSPWSHVHVFRIDLNKNKLSIVTAKSLSLKNASIEQLAQKEKGLITINSGFFDHNYNPLGLRISNNELLNKTKAISWWGIFYVEDNTPHITSINRFKHSEAISFAVQSGPRLIIDNNIPSLKPGLAERTALGITADNKLILLVTDNAAKTTKELAMMMHAPPLSCTNAINLDGGSSTQLFTQMGAFQKSVHGFSNISDAIVVSAR